MLNYLIGFSLARRGLVLAVAGILIVLSIKKTRELPMEVLPDLTKPTVTLLTEAAGYAPEEVEALISIPLENALMGIPGVDRVRCTNDVGLSVVFVEFDWDVDIYKARQLVQERLPGAAQLFPPGVTLSMTPVASLMGDIMLIGLRDRSGEIPPRELRTLADLTISKRLQSIPGIAEVLSMGGGVKQVHVQPDPEKMQLFRVTFEQIKKAAAESVRNSTGGFLKAGGQEIMVRNLAMTTDLEEIGKTVVASVNGRAVLIRDVANVVWDIEPMRGDAAMGVSSGKVDEAGKRVSRGVILSVRKSPGFDSLALTTEVDQALAELRKVIPAGLELIPLYRQSDFIELSIDNLKGALRDGSIMVAIVLFLFLLNFRITLITLTAIPLSLGITILVFDVMGLSVNSMTLGGLAVAVGMVVDDAIVDVENVFRRLRENAELAVPLPRLGVIAGASMEVRASILYATVLIILVFLPFLALSGVEGRLFTPIALATIVSMAASFLVSLTVIPVLCSLLLKPKVGGQHGDFIFVRWLKAGFRATWMWMALKQPVMVLGITAVLMWFGWVAFSEMGRNFLPAFREPTALVATTSAPATALEVTTELGDAALEQLLKIPGIKTAGYRAGRAERGDHIVPVSTVEFDIEFDETKGRAHEDILRDIRAAMRGIPGTFSALSGPLADRVGHMLSGTSAKVAIKIFGPDLAELKRIGDEVTGLAREIPGLGDARAEPQALVPQLRIEPDRDRAFAYGVTPGALNDELSSLMGGEEVAEIYEGMGVYKLVVKLPREWREDRAKLGSLPIDTNQGRMVPLSAVATIREAKGPNNILRENSRRRLVVAINPTLPDLVSAVESLKASIEKDVVLPVGYTISYEGEYQAQKEASRMIAIMSAVVLVVVIFLLHSFFGSFRLVGLVLTILPVSLIGSVFFTQLTLNNVSIATLVGFVTVGGIAARNNIMLLSHYLHLMKYEGEGFTQEMIIRGTEERLVPILMTALSASFALIPLVVAANEPGKEILNPVAIVIVGGLVSSTVLGLAVTPTLFYYFCRGAALRVLGKSSGAGA